MKKFINTKTIVASIVIVLIVAILIGITVLVTTTHSHNDKMFNSNKNCMICANCEHDFFRAFNNKYHYDICLNCGYKKDIIRHEYHLYYDDESHYNECANCDYLKANELHIMEGNECTVCNYIDCNHPDAYYQAELDYHTYTCDDCNYPFDSDPHTLINGACVYCGQTTVAHYGIFTNIKHYQTHCEATLLIDNEYFHFNCEEKMYEIPEGSFVKVIVNQSNIIDYELLVDYEAYEFIENTYNFIDSETGNFSLKKFVSEKLLNKMENPQCFDDITVRDIAIGKDNYGFIFFENGNCVEHANWIIIDLANSDYEDLDFLFEGDWALFYSTRNAAYIIYLG